MATLGQQLKAAREAKGVSAQEAGAATNILKKTIAALEADDFSGIAAPAYAKGFIRLYADFLGVDPAPLIDEYLRLHAPGCTPPDGNTGADSAPREIRPATLVQNRISGLFKRIRLRRQSSGSTGGMPSAFTENIRLISGATAALLVLILLVVSLSNCSRRRAAERSAAQPAPPPARSLLDEPLPDLLLVEPGKVELR